MDLAMHSYTLCLIYSNHTTNNTHYHLYHFSNLRPYGPPAIVLSSRDDAQKRPRRRLSWFVDSYPPSPPPPLFS